MNATPETEATDDPSLPPRPRADPAVIAQEDRKLRRAARIRAVMISLGVVYAVVSSVLLVVVVIAVHQTQLEGTPTGKKLIAGSNRILSCTSTHGACATSNREAQAQIIAGLIDRNDRSAAAAAACAAKPAILTIADTQDRANAILACMVGLSLSKPHQ